jgi:hypothetical protein
MLWVKEKLMGDMADYYADMAASIPDWMMGDDYPTGYNKDYRFDEFRNDEWNLKDGTTITIKEMSDQHLLAAFKMFGDERFRDEMLIRLFEVSTKPRISF